MGIYPVDENGEVSKTPLVLHIPEENGCYRDEKAVWISGMDGAYTQEEMEKISSWGVEMIQGYYFSKPLPEKELLELLKKQDNIER